MTNALIQLFNSNLLEFPRCSHGRVPQIIYDSASPNGYRIDDAFDPPHFRPLDLALTYELIQHNYRRIAALWVDLDVYDARLRAFDFSPQPNVVIANPANGHAHVGWFLTTPFMRAEPGPDGRLPYVNHWANLILNALKIAIGGDTHFNGGLIKNPFHPKWETHTLHTKTFSLQELTDELDLRIGIQQYARRAKLDLSNAEGRNDAMFKSIRAWARRNRGDYQNLASFFDACMEEAESLNSEFRGTLAGRGFDLSPLPQNEIRTICRSVSNYVFKKSTGNATNVKNYGIAQVTGDTTQERQQQGQRYSARSKRDNTIDKLKVALANLVSKGARITQAILSKVSGIKICQVVRYWNLIIGRSGHYAISGFVSCSINTSMGSASSLIMGPLSSGSGRLQDTEATKCEVLQPANPCGNLKTGPGISLAESRRQTKLIAEFAERYKAEFCDIDDPDYEPTKFEVRDRIRRETRFLREIELHLDKEEHDRIMKAKKLAEREARAKRPKKPFIDRTIDQARGVAKITIGSRSMTVPAWFSEGQIWHAYRTGMGIIEA